MDITNLSVAFPSKFKKRLISIQTSILNEYLWRKIRFVCFMSRYVSHVSFLCKWFWHIIKVMATLYKIDTKGSHAGTSSAEWPDEILKISPKLYVAQAIFTKLNTYFSRGDVQPKHWGFLCNFEKSAQRKTLAELLAKNRPILSTTSIYNASVVKIYNATNSIARFLTRIIFLLCKIALAYYNAGVVGSCKFKSRRIGSSWSLRCLGTILSNACVWYFSFDELLRRVREGEKNVGHVQGCQMAYFQTKIYNLG
jgi:hypothetical protein